ncbi:MAG: tetratricopeptide repeat protein [Candidatus Omnitrophica bacterium]|nr:tetratricopeptide repeat protein [Candidatus Omnitrophota bacterium]
MAEAEPGRASRYVGLALCLAALLRFGYLIELQRNPLPQWVATQEAFDQHRFMTLAQEFLAGNWLGAHVTGYSPGYAYVIAGLYAVLPRHLNTLFIVQILLGLAACFVFYRTGTLLFQRRAVGVVAAFLAALYAPFLFYECKGLREILTAYFNLFGFLCLLRASLGGRARWVGAAGAFLGLSMLMRQHVLPALVAPYLLLRPGIGLRTKLAQTLLFLGTLTLTIAPLALRNAAIGSPAVIAPNGLEAFWVGNTPDAPGIGWLDQPSRVALTRESQGRLTKTLEVFGRELRRHPREYRTLYARKIAMFFNGYEIPGNLSFDQFRGMSVALKAAVADFATVCPLGLLGMVLSARVSRGWGLLAGFLALLSLSVIVFHIQGRYRLAAVPFFILPAAYTIWWFGDRWRAGRFARVGAAAVALAGLTILMWPNQRVITTYFGGRVPHVHFVHLGQAYLARSKEPQWSPQQRQALRMSAAESFRNALAVEERPATYFLLGAVSSTLGHQEASEAAFLRGLQLQPDDAPAHRRLAAIYASQGRINEAIEQYTSALRLKPDDPVAHNNLGAMLDRAGRREEATAHFQEALRLRPDYEDAHKNLAILRGE